MIALGGRAAEEIIFGKDLVTTGASSDIEKATEMTLSMIALLGMDEEIGLVNYNVIGNRNLDNKLLLNRTKETLDKLYIETKQLLKDNIQILKALAKKLVEKEVLNEEEINYIISNEV